MLYLSIFLLILPAAGALSARSWLAKGGSGADRTLGLLPFALTDALHPGEERSVWLFEDRFIACISDAVAHDEGCIGALLFTDEGDLVDVSTLLEVTDHKVLPGDQGVWAQLRGVGRCRLKDVRKSALAGYSLGSVALHVDDVAPPLEPLCYLHCRRHQLLYIFQLANDYQ